MNPIPDTFFTTSPHWGWYIVLYFFVGGIAGGCCFLAGLLHFFGGPEDRPTIRAGYVIGLIGAVLSALLLTLDLTKPLRFWHMILMSHRGAPLFKPWSPMSVGAWGLLVFGGVTLMGTLGALGETRSRWRGAAWLARGLPGALLAGSSALLGLFVAGYTGVLLAVTNRPIWAESPLLGALFLCSGVSTAAATLLLLRQRIGQAESTGRWLTGYDRRLLALELVLLVGFLFSLGQVARVWIGWTGGVLLLGVVGAGIVAPALLEARSWRGEPPAREVATRPRPGWLVPGLVLLGGFLLRLVVIAASSRIEPVVSRSSGP